MSRPVLQKYQLTIHVTCVSVAAMVFDAQGNILGKSFADISVRNPEPDWIEVDGEEIWRATLRVCHDAMAKASIYQDQIGSISIASERGAALLWDRVSKEALTPVVASRCRRTRKLTEEWKRKKLDSLLLKRTGLPISDSYGGPKLMWLLGHTPALAARAKKGEVLFGGLDSWILWKLTLGKVHATDYTNAAATMLLSVQSLTWDKGLLAKFKIPPALLPQIKPSGCFLGATEQQGPLAENIPICAMAADQPAALFALTGLERGVAKVSYDRNCHVMMNIGNSPRFSKNGFATMPACTAQKRPSFIVEGILPDGGWSLHWLRDSLKVIDSIQETSSIAESVDTPAELYLIPPHRNSGSVLHPGGVVGLCPGITKGHLVKAALESVVFQTNAMMAVLSKDAGASIRSAFVDGPMSQNDFLLQFQSDISNLEINRTKLGETACLGVASLALLVSKQLKDVSVVRKLRPIDQQFRAKISSGQRKKLLDGWEEAAEKIHEG